MFLLRRLLGLLAVSTILVAVAPLPVRALESTGQPMVLEAEKLLIETVQGRFEFEVEIADEASEQAVGLMFRTELAPRRGMLFDFGEPRVVSMWMKNTPRPLDMVFLARDGTVLSIAERTVPFSEDIITSAEPVSLVLELNAGVARLIGLKPGDRMTHRLFGG